MNPQPEIMADPMMMEDSPSGVFTPDPAWDESKPCLLIFASCHGRGLLEYFNLKPEFRSKYNIMRLETGPIRMREVRGIQMMDRPAMNLALNRADILVTYNMGPRHTTFSMDSIREKIRRDCRVITFTAPNFSALTPINTGYCGALAVLYAFDKGKTVEQLCGELRDGSADFLFGLRWRIEMGRLADRDATHDVKLSDFILRNHRTHKLFMGSSHPSFTTMAYLGSEIMKLLGQNLDNEASVLAYDYTIAAMDGEPETPHEFKHYGFTYPMRHRETRAGGLDYYDGLIRNIWDFWKSGGHCTIPLD